MPPVFGLIANHIDIRLFPCYLLLFALVGFTLTELLRRRVKQPA